MSFCPKHICVCACVSIRSTTVPIEQRMGKLAKAIPVHCTDACVLLAGLCGERKLYLESYTAKIGIERFQMFTLTHVEFQSYTSSSKPAAYVLQNGGD